MSGGGASRVVARPRDRTELVDMLHAMPDADILAGGTDLMVETNFGHRRPERVIALRRVEELRSRSVFAEATELGATVTFSEVERWLGDSQPALAAAARTVGSPQIRNAGTVGGNVVTASPAGDALPVLVALGAELELAGPSGERSIALQDFIVGPKRTTRLPGEALTKLRIPRVDGPQHFLKVGPRDAMVIAVASCAVIADPHRRQVRIGLGAVAPTVIRPAAAEALASEQIDWGALTAQLATLDACAELAAKACTPISDHRGTADYRRHCIRIITRRALHRCLSL